jgi:Zn-dependent protease with chaperone function
MKLINLTQIPTAVCISETAGLNAFAGKQGNVNRMAMTVDALNKFGNDPDAIAAVMGHELAHLKLDHQSIRQSRNKPLTEPRLLLVASSEHLFRLAALLLIWVRQL